MIEIYIHLKHSNKLHTIVFKNTNVDWTFIVAIGYSGGGTFSEFTGKFRINDEEKSEGFYSNSLGLDYWDFQYSEETGSSELFEEISADDLKDLYELVKLMFKYVKINKDSHYQLKQNIDIEFEKQNDEIFYESSQWSNKFNSLISQLWEITLRFE